MLKRAIKPHVVKALDMYPVCNFNRIKAGGEIYTCL